MDSVLPLFLGIDSNTMKGQVVMAVEAKASGLICFAGGPKFL
jgi:hypothetical protein